MASDEQKRALKQLLDRQPRYPIGLYPTPPASFSSEMISRGWGMEATRPACSTTLSGKQRPKGATC